MHASGRHAYLISELQGEMLCRIQLYIAGALLTAALKHTSWPSQDLLVTGVSVLRR